MSDAVIILENLGKKYCLGRGADWPSYTALRDVLADKTKSVAHRIWFGSRRRGLEPYDQKSTGEVWALKDVSFVVKQGEVLGFVGRNGAGKSTLLKILSRITEPTEGRAKIKGRVASLLEVGTGFHPELTGRENIFLNGAILGMTRAEIKSKFDEIVAFADVERFLDTPVKRYSSGMYVRLAFAVAAHLEPEILIVDEVLAVGDADFQMKCLGKMKDVSRSGRTVLFVSHNLASITNLCTRAILLREGRLIEDSTPERTVNAYLKHSTEKVGCEPHVLFESKAPAEACGITRIEALDEEDRPKAIIRPLDYLKLRFWFDNSSCLPQGSVLFEVMSLQGSTILKLETNPENVRPLAAAKDHFVDCCISSLPLLHGHYRISAGLAIYGVRLLSWISDAGDLLVSEAAFGAGANMTCSPKGFIVLEHQWVNGRAPVLANDGSATHSQLLRSEL